MVAVTHLSHNSHEERRASQEKVEKEAMVAVTHLSQMGGVMTPSSSSVNTCHIIPMKRGARHRRRWRRRPWLQSHTCHIIP